MKIKKLLSTLVLIVLSVAIGLCTTACGGGKKCVVTLDANGGQVANGQTSVEVTLNKEYTLPTPTRAGYTFEGWMQDTSPIATTGKWTIETDITVKASWAVRTYNITLDVNGGDALAQTVLTTSLNDDLLVQLPTPTKSGYTFEGWLYNGELLKDVVIWSYDVDATLVAKWLGASTEVTIFPDGGEGLASQKVTAIKGEVLQLPTLTKKGYTFAGWLLNEQPYDATSAWNLDAATATLVAKWTPNDYVLTIDVNGGDPIANNTLTVQYDQEYDFPTVTKSGKTLVRWIISGTETEFDPNRSWYLDSNVTIVAQWGTNITVTVKYGIDGVEDEEKIVVIGESYAFPYEREGYILKNYVIEGTETEIAIEGDDWNYDENKTIVAVWEAKTYNVTIKAYDGSLLTETPIVVAYDSTLDLFQFVPSEIIIVNGEELGFHGFKVEGTDKIFEGPFKDMLWQYDSATEDIVLEITYKDIWI